MQAEYSLDRGHCCPCLAYGLCHFSQSTSRASTISASSPQKPLSRSKSHDNLSPGSSSRTCQQLPVHMIRRHHSVPLPIISCQPQSLQKAAGGVLPLSLADNQPRYIQEVTSGSIALDSDIAASLSGKVSQLEEILLQLQLDLLKEQQDKAALQQQVLNLHQDNLRLQEESHSAAEQIRRFAAWMQRRGSLP
ncbi:hypothetical protein CHARACLAT_025839 [Characodon lateralis]|uniref:Uncharacterized protein n=1 Tax=Characodon lateralis TaxID=208331 RepID=A0ABU7ECV5_9TELE|nr:hypothetical protein [Characodon lateralis]